MKVSAPDLLEAIVAATRKSIESRQGRIPCAVLEDRVTRTPLGGAFQAALIERDRLNIIAECKRRSPSRGVLRAAYDPVSIARAYERAGAVALSVLTEPTFFDGALDHLEAVRQAVSVPLLRKDFIVDEYQLVEAVGAGADAVLLIVAALSDEELARLHQRASSLGLAVLVEVHDRGELDRAVDAGAGIIGVNNRNLRTLDVDLLASETIAARMPKHVIAVCESGLKTRDDLLRMRELGYDAFLIGERFMTSPSPGDALAGVLRP